MSHKLVGLLSSAATETACGSKALTIKFKASLPSTLFKGDLDDGWTQIKMDPRCQHRK